MILNTQDQLETMNALLEELGYHLKELATVPATQSFARAVVEGLDTLLLSIIELSKQFDPDEMQMLKDLTSTEGQGLARIREVYLGGTHDLNPQTKARVLSATNHIERLRVLFGSVGANYEKLAKQPA